MTPRRRARALLGIALAAGAAGVGCGEAPALVESVGATGMRVAAFDPVELSAFLAQRGIPPPAAPLAPMELGTATAFRGALDEIRRDPSAASYGRLGKIFHFLELYDQAQACYERAAETEPRQVLWRHYLGHVAASRHDLEQAERRFREALELDPTSVPSQMQLGMVLIGRDRPDEAHTVLERVAALDPAQPFAPTWLGFIELSQGRLLQAEQWLVRAVAARPDDRHPHWLLAQVYGRTGDEERAALHRRHAGAGVRYPDPVPDPWVFDLRREADALEYLHVAAKTHYERRELPQAIEVMERIVARDPDVAWKERLAEAYSRAGRSDSARELIARAMAQAPDAAGPWLALAKVELHDSDPRAAVAAAQQALERDPEQAEVHRFLANALGSIGEFELGLAHADAALGLDPSSWIDHWQRGKLLFAVGRHAEARLALEAARASAPAGQDLSRLEQELGELARSAAE
jgi:tetratricopeptide (TPR) repeat protein